MRILCCKNIYSKWLPKTQNIAEKLMRPKFYKRISVITNFRPIYGIGAQEKENSIV